MQIVIDAENTLIGYGSVTVGEAVDGRADIQHSGGRLGGANMAVVSVVDGVPDMVPEFGKRYRYQSGTVVVV